MGKSLTDVAKSILNEGAYPSVSPDQNGTFDRDAKTMTTAKSSLRPGAGYADGRFSNPGATPPAAPDNEVEDLGPALVNNTDVPPSAKAAAKMSKDTSKSSRSPVPAETIKKQADIMEEEELDEDIEISEELAAFIDNMVAEGASEEEIAAAIDENFELVSEEAEEIAEETEEYQVDMSEHVEALFAGEELSEEFKQKAVTIFEAAVRQKVEEEIKMLEEAYAETLEEQVAEIQEELSSNVDDYLNYVVEQWVGENEIAIEAGLRSELTEEFISGLRQLFAEHYIDIPEEKVSVVEEMAGKVAELEEKLNEEIERNVALNKMLSESTQDVILADACDGLTDTQAEKLKALAEGLNFTTADEYSQKISILRESYFNSPVNSDNVLDNNEVDTDSKGMISESLNGPMAAYVKTLGRVPKSK
jgi:AcrR family transcriptional regulator